MKLQIGEKEYNVFPQHTDEIIEGVKIDGKAITRVKGLRLDGETREWMDENDNFHGRKFRGVAAVKVGDVLKKKTNIPVYIIGTIDGETVMDYSDLRANVKLEDADIEHEKRIAEKEREQLIKERARLMQKLAKINKRLGL